MSDVFDELENWSPEAKAKLYQRLQDEKAGERRIFYCRKPGRFCDGLPHEGVPYNHARADQWPPLPGGWLTFALVGGRGSGKTRTGGEYTRQMTKLTPRLALIGATNADVRDTMITGISGLEAIYSNYGEKIEYQPSKRRVVFPNGCIGGVFSGEEPDRLRGPQHGFAWVDEPAHYPLIEDVWSNLLFGLRVGADPKIAVTTTPLPKEWLKTLLADQKTVISRVSTRANLTNLSPTFADAILSKYEGTRLGRQEIDGEVLEDVEGALWNGDLLQYSEMQPEEMDRIVVAIDPAGTANRRSDETGIIVVGLRGRGNTAAAHVISDRSGKYSPAGWAEAADAAYNYYRADAIVVEKNYGGDMVKSTLENSGTRARILVKTAMRSKQLRAEPVVSLYEQHRVWHLKDAGLAKLETEMLGWVPGEGDSPNRVDALVWAIEELIDTSPPGRIITPNRPGPNTPIAPSRGGRPNGLGRRRPGYRRAA